MKKKTGLLLLALAMLLMLFACGETENAAEPTVLPEKTVTVSPEETGTEGNPETLSETEEEDTEENGETQDVLPETAGETADPEEEAGEQTAAGEETEDSGVTIAEDGWYYSKAEVALYIHTYGKLPSNYITKKEAEELGWTGGSVQVYKEGAAIGGSKFGNYEGLLPEGHTYYECDIDTDGKSSRGAKRIIFSTDGLIFYTDDHYETFTQLY